MGNCKVFGCPIFQGRPQYTQITTINMCLLNEIEHVHIYNAIKILFKNLIFALDWHFENFLPNDFWGPAGCFFEGLAV